MDYLEISDANGRKRHIKLDQARFLIGREATCDICLPHPNVSRRHAQLQKNDQGVWLLQDLNSLNGTYVNEQRIEQVVLEPGKQIRIGEFRLALKGAPPLPEPQAILPSNDSSAPSWPGLEPGWLEQLQMFQRALLRVDNPRAALERLAEEFQRIARPQLVAVGLNTPEGYTWEVVSSDPSTNGVAESLQLASKLTGTEDSDIQSWHEGYEKGQTPNPAAPYCVLFRMKGRAGLIGHVYVQRPQPLPLPASLQRYLSLYANYAGLLWENLQVIALRSAQKAIELELRQARQIQIELFPSTFEVDDRLNVFAVNLPSVRVSGDYYDLIRTGPDTIAFVIADAMGHGMPAALMMASVRATLRMGLTLGLSWEALFRGVDSIIAQARVNSFVTGLVGHIDLATRQLRMVIAGHQPPSILVAGQPVAMPERCQTRPWGIDFEAEWQVGQVELGDSDWSILCFTDGISDSVMRSKKTFGARRVAEYHKQHRSVSAEDLCQGLLNAVATQSESASLADDQTVLVLRSAPGLDREALLGDTAH
ncbi:MAG TPA: SpoIIE family protein phosphatase [Gemmataceae bacterium]|nr:SpoIIE family protein phosphatase [Gemmataceae bacterium]